MASSPMAIIILVLCTTCIPMRCFGFQQHHTPSTNPLFRSLRWHWEHHDSICIYSTTSSSADKSICDNFSSDNDDVRDYRGESNNVGIELWLDLRGTSLTPKAALELWHLDVLQNNQQQQVEGDGAEYSTKAPFVKCLVSPDARNNCENELNNNVDVLQIEKNDGDAMQLILQRTNASPSPTREVDSIGRILSVQTSSSSAMPILPDPLPAMEVVSKGQWLIVDTNGWKKVAEEDRINMVLPLLELISSGATGGGGIGLTCYTSNEIVNSAMFIQSMIGGNGRGNFRSKTLDSGILIPDDAAGANSASDSGSDRRNNFALIVPYDVGLLQTAKLLCGDTS